MFIFSRRWLGGGALILLLSACASMAPRPSLAPGQPVLGPHYIAWSQHRPPDGSDLWWRAEVGPITREECRVALKRATTRPKVGMTKWYDVSPHRLHEMFGSPMTVDQGTWLSCWPEGYVYGEPDE